MNKKLVLAIGLFLLGGISQSRGDGFIVVERPIYVPPSHFPFAPLEVTSHHVDVKIDGQVAITSIDQEFYNPNDQRLEGIYMFPVPKGAHIDKFSMEIGGKMVDAELLPADKARHIYEDIVRKMRDPALLEYAGRDLFKVRIFPIEPRSRKPIKISYTELLRSDAGTVTYLYPLSTEKFSAQPIKNLSVKIELKSAEPLASIYSPSHKVEIKRDGANRAVIGYESKDEKPDTDFQLVYSSDTRDVGLRLITYKPDGDDGYFLLLAAPTVSNETKPAPKTSFSSSTHPVQWPARNCSRRKKRCDSAWKISTPTIASRSSASRRKLSRFSASWCQRTPIIANVRTVSSTTSSQSAAPRLPMRCKALSRSDRTRAIGHLLSFF